MTALALTAAGRAAIADADHVGTEAVTLTHLAFGDGLRPAGADDDARAALRSERDRIAVAGREAADGHVAVVADWTPARAYALSEIGLVATVDGATVLLAYGAVESAADAVAHTAVGTRIVVALDVAVTSSAADLSVTLSPNVQFTAVPAATTAVAGISRRATGAEAQAAAEASAEADRAALERAAHLTPYEAARFPIDLRDGAPANRDTLAKLATALAAAETRIATLEARPMRMSEIKSPWADGDVATLADLAKAPLVAGNAGVSGRANSVFRIAEAGSYYVEVVENAASRDGNDGVNPALYRGVVAPDTSARDHAAARLDLRIRQQQNFAVVRAGVVTVGRNADFTVGKILNVRVGNGGIDSYVVFVTRLGS